MKKNALLFVFAAFSASILQGQATWDAGVELQAYPTGVIPAVFVEGSLSTRSAVHARIGYNLVRHGDAGVQDDEQGGGFGGTLGYRFYVNKIRRTYFVGLRSDIWFNSIDWVELDDNQNFTDSGTSKVTVLQPTVEAGYLFTLGNGDWLLAPTLAFGWEVNVATKGRETGQGAIFLLGISAGRRF